MKNYSNSDKKINVNNIFLNNRLGLSDTFESGKSLTLGFDFKKESKKNNLDNINKYFELKLATVLRDKEEKLIPKKSTLHRKTSNLFGSMDLNLSKYVQFGYNFAIDNDYSTFDYNDFNLTLSNNNLITTFNFIEENGEMGDTNIFKNSVTYKFDEKIH